MVEAGWSAVSDLVFLGDVVVGVDEGLILDGLLARISPIADALLRIIEVSWLSTKALAFLLRMVCLVLVGGGVDAGLLAGLYTVPTLAEVLAPVISVLTYGVGVGDINGCWPVLDTNLPALLPLAADTVCITLPLDSAPAGSRRVVGRGGLTDIVATPCGWYMTVPGNIVIY